MIQSQLTNEVRSFYFEPKTHAQSSFPSGINERRWFPCLHGKISVHVILLPKFGYHFCGDLPPLKEKNHPPGVRASLLALRRQLRLQYHCGLRRDATGWEGKLRLSRKRGILIFFQQMYITALCMVFFSVGTFQANQFVQDVCYLFDMKFRDLPTSLPGAALSPSCFLQHFNGNNTSSQGNKGYFFIYV